MTRRLMVSITELLEYLRCRRAWNYQSANRMSLQQKGTPAKELWMGSGFHAGFGGHIDGKDPFVEVETFLSERRDEVAADYIRRIGTAMSDEEWTPFNNSVQIVRDVTRNYFAHYGMENTYHTNGMPFRAIGSEVTFMIPFPHLANEYYDEVYLVGTVDALLVNDAVPGSLVVCDHKSFSQKPYLKDLELDGQFVGYCACISALVKRPVTGFLYNGINKKMPKVPQVLTGDGPNKGRLSRQKIDTTYETLVNAIIANGEDPHDTYYTAWLARQRLIDREANPFFVRHYITMPQAALADWWANTEKILAEIAQGPDLAITFNRQWQGCWDCWVRDLCDTQMRGGDLEAVIAGSYTLGKYGTQRTLENTVSPVTVGGLDDLLHRVGNEPVMPAVA